MSLIELIPEPTRLALVETLNRLLVRFHFPSEFLPVRIVDTRRTARFKPSWELVVGKWDTPLKASALSTGQKTQLAMCWCIGLNYALRNEMSQRLMVFDDFTTSLDMGQLIPAATLLRQLAYCENEAYRRQVIVTSHHEDLTNKLLDYLLPPPGRTMKVIQMDEWREESGPTWRTFETAMPLQQWPAREELTRWLNAQTDH